MNLPIQSQPVMRNVSTAAFSGAMETSGLACTLCKAACNALSGLAATACNLACDHTVC